MFSKRKRTRRPARGMTLIEIMVVITLLGLVAAAVGTMAMQVLRDGEIKAARTQAYEVAKSVDTWRLMHGRYPSSIEGLAPLMGGDGRPGLIERVPNDPWRHPYTYTNPGRHNVNRFDVTSRGPDGVEGGNDDVGNWEDPPAN